MLNRSPNGHLHLALVVALVAAFFIALAVPITRTGASTNAGQPGVTRTRDGLAVALRTQAGTLAGMLAAGGPAGPQSAGGPRVSMTTGLLFIPDSLMATAGELAARSILARGGAFAATARSRNEAVVLTIHQEGFTFRATSSAATVGQTLAQVGLTLGPQDMVSPPTSARVTQGMHVYVDQATRVQLVLDGGESTLYTHAATVAGLLAEAGITLGEHDRTYPASQEPIVHGMRLLVVTDRTAVEASFETVPYETVYEYSDDYAEGEEVILQYGVDGYIQRDYSVRLVNGQEVDRTLVAEFLVPPTEEVVVIGTYVPPAPAMAPRPAVVHAGGECAMTMSVWATSYTAASAGGNGVTATGTGVYKGIVATDPRVIPLGTRMYIPGYGYGVAADTGGGVIGAFIDLGYGDNEVNDWSSRWVDICILN